MPRLSTRNLIRNTLIYICIRPVLSFQVKTRQTQSFIPRKVQLQQSLQSEDYPLSTSSSTLRTKRAGTSSLNAFTVEALEVQQYDAIGQSYDQPFLASAQLDWNDLQSIITTALMITGNTIGAGCLVLPEIAAKPGLAISSGLFVGE
jgi:hypothetical protein